MPPAANPEAWAVYLGPVMVFAFVARAGSIYPAMSSSPPLLQHPAISGRLLLADPSAKLIGFARAASTVPELHAALEKAGFQVKRTPYSALERVLRGIG